MAHPAVILTETDVENPMQSVLDGPVPADGSPQDGRIVVPAGKEVADLGLDLVGAVDAGDGLDCQQRAQIGPFVQRLKLSDSRAREDASANQAAVAVVKGVESRPAAGAAAEAGTFEMSTHGLEGAAVIGLQRQEVVGTLGPDPRGNVLLAPHSIERHDGAVEMQGVEQLGEGGDLVRLAIDLALTEHQPLITGPGADQVQRAVIVAAAAGAPDGLAVNRHHLTLHLTRQGLCPAREAALERVRIDQHEDPPERTVRGNTVRQVQKGLQPSLLAAPVKLDVLPAFRASDHRTHRDDENVDQPMIALACYPRIGEPVETRRQTFDHAACLPSPRTGNGWHDPQSAVGSRLMREPWRLADRLEIHHTPKPGSWLNMAEIELSVLARQCLSRRIAHQ